MKKYKIYSKIVAPPISSITALKGNEEYEFDNSLELHKILKNTFNEINFLEIIEEYLEFAIDTFDNFNINQFNIDCSDTDWADISDGVYVVYDLENDPNEENPIYLILLLDVFNVNEFYYVVIKPVFHSSFSQEIEQNLEHYFYIHPSIKKIDKIS